MTLQYVYRTKPFDHQRKLLEETWDREYYAIFWEQGTGKTKVTLDNAVLLYLKGKIDCLFVLAPNGVHRNWIAEEIGKHVAQVVLDHSATYSYSTSKAKSKKEKLRMEAVLSHDLFIIVAMSYDAFATVQGNAFATDLLKRRKCFYVLDESARIKAPKAKRTKAVVKSGPLAPYRRILTGTPISNGPFDIYTQMCFLRKGYWRQSGLANFTVFKNYFALWKQEMLYTTGRMYKKLVNYQNLDELHDIVAKDSSRVTKDDVLDLPPKLYSKQFFEMSPAQKKMYVSLRDEFVAELATGEFVTADIAITRMLRLQQISCGYATISTILPLDADDEEGLVEVSAETKNIDPPGKNRRLNLLLDVLEDTPHKAIIWARFTKDIDQIMEALGDMAVRYDGQTSDDARAEAIDSFQNGKHGNAKYFVANAQAAGEGLTLTAARTVIYYSNDFKFAARMQSEDRAHRIGQNFPVHYIDIVAQDTLDEYIINALKNKQDVARQITGDEAKEWL